MSRAQVLVVVAEPAERASLTSALAAEGYEILTASSFKEGRALLIERSPEVLVTKLRLEEHNGIHLAIVSRLRSASTKTIVIGYGDPVLEAEATQAGAVYLAKPGIDEVLEVVDAAIHRPERKWPRIRTNITAQAADQPVRLIDLSYGGFRMELPSDTPLTTNHEFDLTVGPVRVSAFPVWMKPHASGERVWCGAIVASNGERNDEWRALVDTTLGTAQYQ